MKPYLHSSFFGSEAFTFLPSQAAPLHAYCLCTPKIGHLHFLKLGLGGYLQLRACTAQGLSDLKAFLDHHCYLKTWQELVHSPVE